MLGVNLATIEYSTKLQIHHHSSARAIVEVEPGLCSGGPDRPAMLLCGLRRR